jgi:hypothetical protein
MKDRWSISFEIILNKDNLGSIALSKFADLNFILEPNQIHQGSKNLSEIEIIFLDFVTPTKQLTDCSTTF